MCYVQRVGALGELQLEQVRRDVGRDQLNCRGRGASGAVGGVRRAVDVDPVDVGQLVGVGGLVGDHIVLPI